MSEAFKQFVQEIKARVPIEDVVGEAVIGLKRSGRTLKGLCPFHAEKTPSFHIHPEFGFYRCFGCGVHGDVITFVMEHEKIDFKMAVESLARRFGVPIPDFGPPVPPEERDEKEKQERILHEISKAAEEFFVASLAKHPDAAAARKYLTDRGLTPEQVADYRLGYAPADYDALIRELARRGYSAPRAVEAGLAIRRDNGGFIDRFRDRVIFPIASARGETVAFGGRLVQGEGPKYLNSADSPIFHKGKLLYGMAGAREAIRDSGFVILLEGYMDWIALHSHGVRNVLAGLGTAFTDDQARLLRRITKEAVLFYDGDMAGRKAAAKTAELLLGEGLRVRVAGLPAGPVKHDPDSFIRAEGPAATRALIEVAKSAIDYFLDEAVTELKPFNPEGKAAVADALAPLLRAVSDPVLLEDYAHRVADRLNLAPSALESRLKARSPRRQFRDDEGDAKAAPEPGEGQEPPVAAGPPRGIEMLELCVIHRAVQHIEIFEVLFHDFGSELFSTPILSRLFERLSLLASDIREGLETPVDWLGFCEDDAERSALTRALLIEEHVAEGGLRGKLTEADPGVVADELAQIKRRLLRRSTRRERGEERMRTTSGGHAENAARHGAIHEAASLVVRAEDLHHGRERG